jgi:uncharacterized protein YndB with AHSA1/START domain
MRPHKPEAIMPDSFTLTAYIPAPPQAVYDAWLNGERHAAMTGSPAHGEPVVGAHFDAWNGYVRGTNLELEPGQRIFQSWRAADFPQDAPDSRLEIEFRHEGDGTRLILRHTGLPDGKGTDYEQGWEDSYFEPMRAFFIREMLAHVRPPETAPEAVAQALTFLEPGMPSEATPAPADRRPPAAPPAPAPTAAPVQAVAPAPRAERPAAPKKPAAVKKGGARRKAAVKKAVKKTTARATRKAGKKAVRKAVKKAAPKKRPARQAAKKTAKKASKKPAKKAAKRPAKKAAKKPARKAAARTARKAVKRPAKAVKKKAAKPGRARATKARKTKKRGR